MPSRNAGLPDRVRERRCRHPNPAEERSRVRAAHPPAAGPHDPGFTLVEVLVVLAILGLVVGLVIARGPMRSPGFLLRSEAQILSLRLGEARGRAIATDRDVAVRLRANPPGLSIEGGRGAVLPHGLSLGMLTADGAPAAPTGALVFHPDGGANAGGLLLTGAAGSIAIEVSWLTGRITVAPK